MISRLQIQISLCLLVLSAYLVYAMEAPQENVSQEKSASQKKFESTQHIFTLTPSFDEQPQKAFGLLARLMSRSFPGQGSLSSDGRFVFVKGNHDQYRVINAKTGDVQYEGTCPDITQFSFSPDGTVVSILSEPINDPSNNKVIIIDLGVRKEINTIKVGVDSSVFKLISREELVISTDHEYVVHNVKSGNIVLKKSYPSEMYPLAISEDGSLIAGAYNETGSNKTVVIIDIKTRTIIQTFDIAKEVNSSIVSGAITLSASNRLVSITFATEGVLTGWKRTTTVFDVKTGKLIGKIDNGSDFIFDFFENLIALVNRYDPQIVVMDTKTGTVSTKAIGDDNDRKNFLVIFSSVMIDGKYLVFERRGSPYRVFLMDIDTGRNMGVMEYPAKIGDFGVEIKNGVLLAKTVYVNDVLVSGAALTYITDLKNVQNIVNTISLSQYELLVAFQRAACDKGRIHPTDEQRQTWELLKKLLRDNGAELAIKRLEPYIKQEASSSSSSSSSSRVERVPRSPRRTNVDNDWLGVSCSIQ